MIHVEALVKNYTVSKKGKGLFGRQKTVIRALDGLSFHMDAGEVVGYIGPNGAGKSTTIKILSGILYPDGGTCTVNGRVPWKQRVDHVRGIGVVFGQKTQLWWDLPARDSLELLGDMYSVNRARRDQTITTLRAELDLDSFLDTPVRQLSLGQRMRCELAAALVHEPAILFLDEPTIGLDAPSKLALRDFIGRLNRERGTTIILTTHDMDDVDALASRVVLIGKGRDLFDGNMAALRREAGAQKRLVLDLAASLEGTAAASPDPRLRLIAQDGSRLVFGYDPDGLSTSEALALAARNFQVADMAVEAQPVEELISALYARHGI